MEPEIDVSDGMKKTSPSKRTERRNFSSYPGKNKKKAFHYCHQLLGLSLIMTAST
jgi:hypothetical protein